MSVFRDNRTVTDINPSTDAAHFLRRHYQAVIDMDGTIHKRNYVIDGAAGCIVVSLQSGIEESESIVMYIPDEGTNSIQLLVEGSWLDPSRDAACDRLLIYHQRAEAAKFASMRIVDAKWEDRNVEGAKISLKNDLEGVEPRLCRLLNTDRRKLEAIVHRETGRETFEARAVGVDTRGIDVRTRTGIVRCEFEAQLSRDQAIATIERWTGLA